jgi:multicomponent Na+:H+ antiporter subunit E
MVSYIATFLLSFVAYLFLTASQGEILGLWSKYEIIAAVIVSLIIATISTKVLFQKKQYRLLNPLRWFIFLFYLIGPFFIALVKANLDVAYRVITGRINPYCENIPQFKD